ncbi:MAG: HAD-IIA family hydrolase [Synergistaceae bacterium]|jgi:HAD superfamily hydrolase (TIGR01450 family)|nr:HAD-IIA family hydrolase [Synergistaceae bacterium]
MIVNLSDSPDSLKWEKNEDPRGLLKKVLCFLLDLDGTVYLDDRWIPGAPEFLERLKRLGKKFVFLTNNSSRGRAAYFEKLAKMGLIIEKAQLATSGDATIQWLRREMPGKRVFLAGTPSLKEDFLSEGVTLDDETPDAVVLAFDTGLDYAKLVKLCNLVRSGKPFIATHPDFNCPGRTGPVPDVGSFLACVEASTGRRPDLVIGKPNAGIVDYALGLAGALKEHSALVGDRLYTDIPSGVNNGLLSVCVLSGESTLEDVLNCEIQPHLVFDSLREMIPFLQPAE